jgi:pimeloyl-ACP methyl ester carboxylesterase
MFVREGGRKDAEETVILVHGFPTSSHIFARSHEILEKEFRVVMFDHIGFGFSDKPDTEVRY